MNDLISRSALMEDFRNTISEKSDTFDWLNMISRQPAYDVDKIVEKLAKCEQRLNHYEDLEEQGLLLKLPCKVGDTIWCIKKYSYCPAGICHMDICSQCRKKAPWTIKERKFRLIDLNEIGKTVFITRAEAEEALKKMNGTEDKK